MEDATKFFVNRGSIRCIPEIQIPCKKLIGTLACENNLDMLCSQTGKEVVRYR